MKKVLLILVIYLVAGHCFADTAICQMHPGGILDKFQNDFYNQAKSFSARAMPTITAVYWLLFGLWALWELTVDKIIGMNIDRLYVWWIMRICVAYLIQHIFLDPSLYIGVLKFGADLGSKMGGFAVKPDSGSPLGAFTPSAIMGINDCVAIAVKNASDQINPLNILASLELFIIQMGFLLVTALAAFYVLYLSIKIWIALFVGLVNVMFAGSSWTINWWQQYLTTVIRYAMELLIVSALFGVIYNQLIVFVNQLTAADADIVNNFGIFMKTMAEIAFMVFLLLTLPSEISRSLGGTFSGKVNNFASRLVSKGGEKIGVSALNSMKSFMQPSGTAGINPSSNPPNSGGGGSATNAADWKPPSGNQSSSNSSPISGEQWKQATSEIKDKLNK